MLSHRPSSDREPSSSPSPPLPMPSIFVSIDVANSSDHGRGALLADLDDGNADDMLPVSSHDLRMKKPTARQQQQRRCFRLPRPARGPRMPALSWLLRLVHAVGCVYVLFLYLPIHPLIEFIPAIIHFNLTQNMISVARSFTQDKQTDRQHATPSATSY
jgi:hypothetical protein